MSGAVDVGAVDDFEAGKIRIVQANGREIGIARWNDELFALRNVCPHQAAPVCRGRLLAHMREGGVGEMEADMSVPIVACAWHGWEFRVRTGESVSDPMTRIRTYEVTVEDGRVLVQMGGSARA